MNHWQTVVLLWQVTVCVCHPGIWREELESEDVTPALGPPEILPEGDPVEDYHDLETGVTSLEITAVVSRSPIAGEDMEKIEEKEGNEEEQDPTEINSEDVLVEVSHGNDLPALHLDWWQLLLLLLACLLITCLCCHLTGCCFLTADCCSDPYWGCCSSLHYWVPRLKPPANAYSGLRWKNAQLSNSCSLNESSTAPRRSIERSARSLASKRGSSEGLITSTPMKPEIGGGYDIPKNQDSLQSAKSVMNYKRTPPSMVKDRHEEGMSESLPHVYKESSGSYFNWLHLLNRSSRRYNVSPSKKYRSSLYNNNNTVYRQNTRYRHIADNSRNSAVIPTKISKRTSTASTFTTRPYVSKRSRSAETLESLEDRHEPLLEMSKSERNIPRSRLSANLAQLEAGRSERVLGGSAVKIRRMSGRSTPVSCPTAPALSEYNLNTIEKSLLKSKETSL